VIKYIGSKRVLVPLICDVIQALQPAGTVVDLFSGTSRVGHALKRLGYAVSANDLNTYASVLARCYVQADAETVLPEAEALLAEMAQAPSVHGYFTETFCEESRYFQPHNGIRIDGMREWVAAQELDPELEAVLLVALMEGADRVDSTTGLQMAYLKAWAPRSFNDIELRLPDVLPAAASGRGSAHQLDAADAARLLTADVGYLDPPYNQHKYLGNYHIWETLCLWDSPEAYGVAKKRIDCRDRRSSFNSKPRIRQALQDVIDNLDVRHLVVSFNNEGYLDYAEIVEMLSHRGDVLVVEAEHKRYVGAQIGIHSPSGERVGTVSHLSNKEFLFVVPNSDARADALADELDRRAQTHGARCVLGHEPILAG
jgi:adenine-specific DNA-methyltransferase